MHLTDEMKAFAKHLLGELTPVIGDAVRAEVAKVMPAAAPLIDAAMAGAEVAFLDNEPGIGGPPPEVPEGATVEARLTAVEHKLDALVQATGHGNSAAMGAHL